MLEGSGHYPWCFIEEPESTRGLIPKGIRRPKEVWMGVKQGRKEPRVHQGLVGSHQKG
jgi:hypothetical protein